MSAFSRVWLAKRISLSRSHTFFQRGGHLTVRLKLIDLKRRSGAAGQLVQHIGQRGVLHDPAIPIMLTVNLDRRKARRQRPTSHDMLGLDRDFGAV